MRIMDKNNLRCTENRGKEKKATRVNLKEDCNCIAHHFCFSLSYTTGTSSSRVISYSLLILNLIWATED